jgi:hypothetical protein
VSSSQASGGSQQYDEAYIRGLASNICTHTV